MLVKNYKKKSDFDDLKFEKSLKIVKKYIDFMLLIKNLLF